MPMEEEESIPLLPPDSVEKLNAQVRVNYYEGSRSRARRAIGSVAVANYGRGLMI